MTLKPEPSVEAEHEISPGVFLCGHRTFYERTFYVVRKHQETAPPKDVWHIYDTRTNNRVNFTARPGEIQTQHGQKTAWWEAEKRARKMHKRQRKAEASEAFAELVQALKERMLPNYRGREHDLVDLFHRKRMFIMDRLLEGHSADQIADWMQEHPEDDWTP